MALTDDLTLGLFEVLGIAIILRYGLLFTFDQALPTFVRNHAWLVSLLSAYALVAFDWLVVYRRFRSPLRRLPVVKRENVMAERPRGRIPLKWFRWHPDADMINMRGFIAEVLYPASPEALRDILNTHSYDWEKPWGIRAFLARIIGFGLISSEGDPHRRQRKFLTPAFHVRNIRDLYGTMWDKTNIFIDQLGMESAEKGHVEISQWASKLTLDIIGPAALSRDFASLTTTDTHPVVEAFLAVLDPSPELVTFMVLNTLLPQFITTRLPVRANKLIRVYCTRLQELCQNILDEKHDALKRLKSVEEAKENDILQHIVETGEFTDEELVAQMLTFLAAGHETTASALTWASYLLCLHPEVQKRLREEVRKNIQAPNSAIEAATFEAMPLLNGVCEEVLRLFPTVPLTIREAQRETIVAGTKVPKGTIALIVPYAINRHPRNWGPDAEEFQPERWIDTLPDGAQRPNKHGGAPNNFCEATFLHGPRSCIGQNFAKAELRCAVAGFVGRFHIELAEPEREVIIGGTVTTKPVGGLKLKLTPIEGW